MPRGAAAFETESDDEAHVTDRILDEYWQFCDEKGLHCELEIPPSAHKLNSRGPDQVYSPTCGDDRVAVAVVPCVSDANMA